MDIYQAKLYWLNGCLCSLLLDAILAEKCGSTVTKNKILFSGVMLQFVCTFLVSSWSLDLYASIGMWHLSLGNVSPLKNKLGLGHRKLSSVCHVRTCDGYYMQKHFCSCQQTQLLSNSYDSKLKYTNLSFGCWIRRKCHYKGLHP